MKNYFKVCDIQKSYQQKDGSLKVLNGISFSVQPQEFICIMGNSGCGKSTLIKIIEGIENPDDGIIIMEDKELTGKTTKSIQKRFGIVYQSASLFDWLSAYKNVEFPLKAFKDKDKSHYRERIYNALKLVGLEDFANCYPHELSGGMRQRCAIARALVTDPEILMLDQPFGALDAITRRMLNYELLKIQHETKKTCIMITNSVNEAILLGQRILVMSNHEAKIVNDIQVPFTYEQRMGDLSENKEYLSLRHELTNIVRNL